MKLTYSKSELKKSAWATISSRIEDFVNMSPASAYKEIEKTYGELTDEVFAGLCVYKKYGTEIYNEGF